MWTSPPFVIAVPIEHTAVSRATHAALPCRETGRLLPYDVALDDAVPRANSYSMPAGLFIAFARHSPVGALRAALHTLHHFAQHTPAVSTRVSPYSRRPISFMLVALRCLRCRRPATCDKRQKNRDNSHQTDGLLPTAPSCPHHTTGLISHDRLCCYLTFCRLSCNSWYAFTPVI